MKNFMLRLFLRRLDVLKQGVSKGTASRISVGRVLFHGWVEKKRVAMGVQTILSSSTGTAGPGGRSAAAASKEDTREV